ncbi:hypothetical protein ACFT5B_02955 [Luteimicrobium sp. NPDC057192]|uniref:hypothetical protein n=1 Tax=Luteimicrobium sp. NPDC057192 TaxID=3346042 RepID=UPI0036318555
MAQWEDDLRAVVEHRGAALLWHAHRLVDPVTVAVTLEEAPEDAPDAALELAVDALVTTFRHAARRGRDAGGHGSVRLVTDDDLDALEQSVRAAQDRLAPPRPATFVRRVEPLTPPDDGPSDDLTARLPEVVARVREARRGARRRTWVVGAAAVVVVAVAASAVAGWPWKSAAADPEPTVPAYAGACGTTLPTGPSLLPVSLTDDESEDRAILAGSPWFAQYTGDASALSTDELATLDSMTPELVLVKDGNVVALGVDTGQVQYMAPDGSMSTERSWPGVAEAGVASDAGDVTRYADYVADDPGTAMFSVRFESCTGGTVPAGEYRAYLFGTTDDRSAHVLSDAAPVTVLPATPAGYQPRWLEGSALACGETVDEFLIRVGPHPFIDLDTVGVVIHDDGLTYPLKNSVETARTDVLPKRAALAWVQHDRIVGVGPDERGTAPRTVEPGKTVTLSARPWDTTDYCATGAVASKPLKPGTYRVLAYARVPAHDPADPDTWILQGSGPDAVVVHDDGSVTMK